MLNNDLKNLIYDFAGLRPLKNWELVERHVNKTKCQNWSCNKNIKYCYLIKHKDYHKCIVVGSTCAKSLVHKFNEKTARIILFNKWRRRKSYFYKRVSVNNDSINIVYGKKSLYWFAICDNFNDGFDLIFLTEFIPYKLRKNLDKMLIFITNNLRKLYKVYRKRYYENIKKKVSYLRKKSDYYL
jgi:hypothetical protein